MWFKLAFAISFAFALTVAARTARRAARHHRGTLNQLGNEVRGLLAVRATLGIVFYASLTAWMFWPRNFTWMYLPVPTTLRWIAVGLLPRAAAVRESGFLGVRSMLDG